MDESTVYVVPYRQDGRRYETSTTVCSNDQKGNKTRGSELTSWRVDIIFTEIPMLTTLRRLPYLM